MRNDKEIEGYDPKYANYDDLPVGTNYSKDIPEWLAQATGRIKVIFSDQNQTEKETGTGTAFHIGNGYFLTAGHCFCSNAKKYSGSVSIGNKSYEITDLPISVLNEKMDFAIFKIDKTDLPKVTLISVQNPTQTKLNQKIVITHHPKGSMEIKCSRGHITQMVNTSFLPPQVFGKSGCFFYTNQTMRGTSGAPVSLENEQKVMGVHIEGEERLQGFHGAMNIYEIHQYIMNNSKKYPNGLNYFINVPIPKNTQSFANRTNNNRPNRENYTNEESEIIKLDDNRHHGQNQNDNCCRNF